MGQGGFTRQRFWSNLEHKLLGPSKNIVLLFSPRFLYFLTALIMKCHHRSLAINQETDNFQSETEEKKGFILIFLSRIKFNIEDSMRFIVSSTDYGRPMQPFFIKIPHFLGLGRQFGQIILGHLGYFRQIYQHHFGTVSPLSKPSINQTLFLQKMKSLYPHPKYQFGIGICTWAAK